MTTLLLASKRTLDKANLTTAASNEPVYHEHRLTNEYLKPQERNVCLLGSGFISGPIFVN